MAWSVDIRCTYLTFRQAAFAGTGHSTDWKNEIVTGKERPGAVIRDKRAAISHEVVRRYSPVPA